MKKYCYGVDIGGTAVKLGVFTIEGELIKKWEIKTRREDNSSYILPDIAKTLEDTRKEMGIALEEVVGLGFGTPGPVTEDGVAICPANLDWINKPVAKELSDLTGLPCKGGNDVNVAGLGELWRGGAKGYKNAVVVPIGTGVGAAIIVNGKIIAGSTGAAGEVGHIHVDNEIEESCGCGATGCVEQFSSATGLVRMAKKLLRETDRETVLRNLENVTAKDVIDAAKAGDELALASVNKSMYYLGWVMASVTMVVDPQAYIIGGGVSRAGTFLTDIIQKYHDALSPMSTKKAKVVLAELGNDAGIYGAAKLVLD